MNRDTKQVGQRLASEDIRSCRVALQEWLCGKHSLTEMWFQGCDAQPIMA